MRPVLAYVTQDAFCINKSKDGEWTPQVYFCKDAFPVKDSGNWEQHEYHVLRNLGIVKNAWLIVEVWKVGCSFSALVEMESEEIEFFDSQCNQIVLDAMPECGFDIQEELF